MFRTIANLIPSDPDYPARARTLDIMRRVRDGTFYDVLGTSFHDEHNAAGEYIPIRQRAPSVRYALPKLVVDESVSMLFGEGRFPSINCEDVPTRDALKLIAKECRINQVMTEAAIRGSIGSVCILVRVLKGRLFLKALDTPFLTPEWQDDAPDTLARVTEAYKATGRALKALGYVVADAEMDTWFWFRRTWDDKAETWFLPQTIADFSAGTPLQIDPTRTVEHKLGFCPMVWIRNLPGGDDIDGACTFRAAVETSIEIDYQLSQGGRGLKYSSDPTLLIKEPAAEGTQVKGGGQAVIVSENGDAKMLEINGTAVAAVIEYVRVLREFAIESVHGNRTASDKISATQSGRAMELMHQALINMTDHLRSSYGEDGLLPLLRMIVLISEKMPLLVFGAKCPPLKNEVLSLRWPAWFAPTQHDKLEEAQALDSLTNNGSMSQESRVNQVCDSWDIADPTAELARVKTDEAAADARAAKQAAAIAATETVPA